MAESILAYKLRTIFSPSMQFSQNHIFNYGTSFKTKKKKKKKKGCRSSPPKCAPKMRSKPTGEHPCQIPISSKPLCDFASWHGRIPRRFTAHLQSTTLQNSTPGWLLLKKKFKNGSLEQKDIHKQTWVTGTNCNWNFINLHIH